MAIEIAVPPLGWSMEEGLFAGWRKQDGDEVRPGDVLYTIESDKATQEIESLDGGLLRILPGGPREGDKVTVGTLLGYLVKPGESAPVPGGAVAGTAKKHEDADLLAPVAGPAARKLARELEVDLRQVSGTGPSGRVTSEDVRRAVVVTPPPAPRLRPGPAISPRAKRIAAELGIDWMQLRGTGRTGRIRERDIRAATAAAQSAHRKVPVSPLRKTIAARMLQSAQSTAPVTLTTTTDATNLVNLRNQFKDASAAGDVPIPSYTDFLVKLAALALKQHPLLNSRWYGEHILILNDVHVGIAVDTEAGLLVPVIRDVVALGLRQLAAQSRDLIDRARQRKLTADEMQGGTFTVTNLGAFGIDAFTPVINFPEAAVLGIGRIRREPVVVDNQVAIRDVVTLSLTFDHRIVDGAPAARFLQLIGECVKNPGPWLM